MRQKRSLQPLDLSLMVGTLAGVALIVLGSQVKISFLPELGAALLGASLVAVIASHHLNAAKSEIKAILSRSTGAELRSAEDEIDYYRRTWHIYIFTSLDGHLLWRHAVLDFGSSYVAGSVRSDVPINDIGGLERKYIFEGACRNQRFILTGRPEKGNEPCTVAVYPFIGQDFRRVGPGVCFITTWDGSEAMTPTLLSAKPLEGAEKPGNVSDENGAKLSALWRASFQIRNLVPNLRADRAPQL